MTALADIRTTIDVRDELTAGLERLSASYHNKQVDESHVIGCMRDWRPGMSAVGLWVLWEQTDDAIRRLDHIRGDDFDPADGDRDLLEYRADDQLTYCLDRLTGVRP